MRINRFIATITLLLLSSSILDSKEPNFLYANNMHQLSNLAVFDLTLFEELEAMKNAVQWNSTVRQLIDAYLEDFRDTNGVDQAKESVDLAAKTGNPISAYRLVRRCHVLAPQIFKEAELDSDGMKLSDGVTYFSLPTSDDMVEAIDAILRIQKFYRVNVTQFASGNIFGSIVPSRLRSSHCVEIGDRALEQGVYSVAYEWYQEAKRLAPLDQTVSAETSIIEKKINTAIKLHDAAWTKEEGYDRTGHRENRTLFAHALENGPVPLRTPKIRDATQLPAKFRLHNELLHAALCSRDNLQTPEETAGQFCWLEFKIHPQYRIGPLKMEFLSRYPAIVRIHNASFPGEVERVRASARAMSHSHVSGERKTVRTSTRSSSSTRMIPKADRRYSRKIGRMVGLNAVGTKRTAEQVQITSYTAGGGYAAHTDSYGAGPEGFQSYEGDRLMTFMTYLNTVDQGGYTVFPVTLTQAEPIKGSAIFWFNLFSDGNWDYSSHHVSCPVIQGQKWIATKWIPMYDQFLKKQCLLEPKERFQVPVNGQLLPIPENSRKIWRHMDDEEDSLSVITAITVGAVILGEVDMECAEDPLD